MLKNKPILITGSHRSGTTWVGKTISVHPDVMYVNEPFNINCPNPEMEMGLDFWFTDYYSTEKKEEIAKAFNKLLLRSHLHKTIKICKEAGLDAKTPLRFIKHLLVTRDTDRKLVKDPVALLSAGWLYEEYDFNVIVMIRSPLAFVGSLKVAGWDFDFKDLYRQKILMNSRLSKFSDEIKYMCSKGNESDFIDRVALLWNILHFIILDYKARYPSWLFVRHEDISEHPASGFRHIFQYLNLEFELAVQDHITEYTSQINPEQASSTSFQPRNSKKSLSTWKKRLTSEEVARVTVATHEIATKLYGKTAVEF